MRRYLLFAYCLSSSAVIAEDLPERVGVFYDSVCHNCHVIRDGGGVLLAGTNLPMKGPNLYGIVGRTAGSAPDFIYSEMMVASRDAGLVWTKEELLKFLENPTMYLRHFTGMNRGQSLMSERVLDEQVRSELVDFVAKFGG